MVPVLILQLICWCPGWALERLGVRPVRMPWWVTEWLIGAGATLAGSIIHLHVPAWGAFPPRNWVQVAYLTLAMPTVWTLARAASRRRLARLAPHVAEGGGGFVEIRELRHGRLLLRVPGAALAGQNLAGAPLAGADLWAADLSRANLRGADLRGAYLVHASLEAADLREARFDGAFLQKANLIDANLEHASLAEADLRGAVYSRREGRHHRLEAEQDRTHWPAGFNPHIREAVALGPGAELNHTRLVGADLRARDLTGASFRGADLRRADLSGADLSGADLSSARLEETHLEGAIYNPMTRWPAEFDPDAAGAPGAGTPPITRQATPSSPGRWASSLPR